jgi:hypothetical protein
LYAYVGLTLALVEIGRSAVGIVTDSPG